MANPPFNLDVTDPADNAIVSQFPSNERIFRDNANSYLGIEHDINTGYHKFQVLTQTQISALTSPPTGMLVYSSTVSQMQVNIGTSSAPSWVPVGGVPVGTSIEFNGTAAPAGFLVEDGSAVSRTTYANLFSVIGTTWGAGDGSTTFNLPTKTRRVSVGSGGSNTSGKLGTTVGSLGGEETHVLTAAESAVLTYAAVSGDSGHSHGGNATFPNIGSGVGLATGSGQPYTVANTEGGYANISTTVSSNAGGGAHSIVQLSAVVLKCIKY